MSKSVYSAKPNATSDRKRSRVYKLAL